ncbi:hypothetical protein CC86DRAFT_375514 [Ophiobolus disseminans]|uniref:C2H2-type domain-containing protein n=1 Tax=Ophiobolus disseminans TaxID=1469910 RepID=A0A6A6ZCN7_9PLEO|nr:hypothetical protein CC86DRAFT_375514 [Ophiobolus disseminans]
MHDAFEHDPFQDSTFGYDHALPVDTYTVGNDNLDGVCHDHPGLSEDDLTLVTCTGTIAPSTLPAPTTLGFSSASNDPFGFSDWTYLGNPSPSAAGQYHLATDFSTLTQIPSASPSDHRTFPMGNAFQPIASAAPLNITAMSFGPGPVTGTIANEVRIPCTFAGCTRTFRRAGDCRRHMGKHQARAYNCIESECEKRFYRLDKLRDHLRQGHGITL